MVLPLLVRGLRARRRRRSSGSAGSAGARFHPGVEGLERIRLLALEYPDTPLTFTVNSTDDVNVGTLNSDGTITGYYPGEVNFATAVLAVNLQEEDLAANGLAPVHDTINFDILPGTTFGPAPNTFGTWVNAPSGPYMIPGGGVLSGPVTINAMNQPGYAAGQPQVYIDGLYTDEGSDVDGLDLNGGESTVEGLGFTGFIEGLPDGEGESGVVLADLGSDTIEGCVFGINGSGKPEGNATDIDVETAGNVIGGTTAAERNIIANAGFNGIAPGTGIYLGESASGNLIEGNYIGIDFDGSTALANTGDGINFTADGNNSNTIGGSAAGAGNIVAENGYDGVAFDQGEGPRDQSTGDAIEGNLIFGNAKLGIDLGDTGAAVPNGAEGHVGPNNFQNFPVVQAGASGTITGTLASPAGTYHVEDFADVPGANPGQVLLGSQSVTTRERDTAGGPAGPFADAPGSPIAVGPGGNVVHNGATSVARERGRARESTKEWDRPRAIPTGEARWQPC